MRSPRHHLPAVLKDMTQLLVIITASFLAFTGCSADDTVSMMQRGMFTEPPQDGGHVVNAKIKAQADADAALRESRREALKQQKQKEIEDEAARAAKLKVKADEATALRESVKAERQAQRRVQNELLRAEQEKEKAVQKMGEAQELLRRKWQSRLRREQRERAYGGPAVRTKEQKQQKLLAARKATEKERLKEQKRKMIKQAMTDQKVKEIKQKVLEQREALASQRSRSQKAKAKAKAAAKPRSGTGRSQG